MAAKKRTVGARKRTEGLMVAATPQKMPKKAVVQGFVFSVGGTLRPVKRKA
jgi:hypothetical protein